MVYISNKHEVYIECQHNFIYNLFFGLILVMITHIIKGGEDNQTSNPSERLILPEWFNDDKMSTRHLRIYQVVDYDISTYRMYQGRLQRQSLLEK